MAKKTYNPKNANSILKYGELLLGRSLRELLLTTATILSHKKKKTNYKTTGRLSVATCNRFIMIIRMQKSVTNSWLVSLTFFVQISC